MISTHLNNLSEQESRLAFETCCVSPRWIEGMMASRPFSSDEAVFEQAQTIWDSLEEADFLAAFEGHPQIGDVSTLRAKFANTAAKAGHEQSGMNSADEAVLQEMMALNKTYLDNFGFIFIVCATGKSASEMLALIRDRVNNDRATELAIAAGEQAKITKIRLEKLL